MLKKGVKPCFLLRYEHSLFASSQVYINILLISLMRGPQSSVTYSYSMVFDVQNGQNMDNNYDFRKCAGLKVKPRRGDGLVFYSLFPNGTIDPVSGSAIYLVLGMSYVFIASSS